MAAVVLGVAGGCDEAGDVERESPPPGSGSAAEVSFEATPALPGDLFLEEGILRFQPCGQGYAEPLDDGTAGEAMSVVRELGYGEGRVRAVAVLDGGRLVELRHAAPEAPGCRDLLPDADVEARGNEPFWALRVDGTRASWITPEAPDGTGYANGSWARPEEGVWRFEARRDGADGVEYLTLVLSEERCTDSMSGARFPFSARVERSGRTFEGCALEGRSAVADP